MKKFTIAIAMTSLLLFGSVLNCQAQEQTIDNQNSYLGVNVEKTPEQVEGKQRIKNVRSFLNIDIIVNGKIKECKPEVNNKN